MHSAQKGPEEGRFYPRHTEEKKESLTPGVGDGSKEKVRSELHFEASRI